MRVLEILITKPAPSGSWDTDPLKANQFSKGRRTPVGPSTGQNLRTRGLNQSIEVTGHSNEKGPGNRIKETHIL